MNFTVTYGRTDGTAIKKTRYRSRTRAIDLANNLAFVMFGKHPFKFRESKGILRHEGQGFYVQYEEDLEDDTYHRR
jgi:hypothetical protein